MSGPDRARVGGLLLLRDLDDSVELEDLGPETAPPLELEAAIALTQGWGLPRPSDGGRALPGALGLLRDAGLLPVDAPGLPLLARWWRAIEGSPAIVDRERGEDFVLEQVGWPLFFDLHVAADALRPLLASFPLGEEALARSALVLDALSQGEPAGHVEIERWLARALALSAFGAGDPDGDRMAAALHLGRSMTASPDRGLASFLHAHATWAEGKEAELRALSLIHQIAHEAEQGWTAHEAYQRQPSAAARATLDAARLAHGHDPASLAARLEGAVRGCLERLDRGEAPPFEGGEEEDE